MLLNLVQRLYLWGWKKTDRSKDGLPPKLTEILGCTKSKISLLVRTFIDYPCFVCLVILDPNQRVGLFDRGRFLAFLDRAFLGHLEFLVSKGHSILLFVPHGFGWEWGVFKKPILLWDQMREVFFLKKCIDFFDKVIII